LKNEDFDVLKYHKNGKFMLNDEDRRLLRYASSRASSQGTERGHDDG
jgi:hypothetical protein